MGKGSRIRRRPSYLSNITPRKFKFWNIYTIWPHRLIIFFECCLHSSDSKICTTFSALTYITPYLFSLQVSLSVTSNKRDCKLSTATDILLRQKHFRIKRPNCVSTWPWPRTWDGFLTNLQKFGSLNIPFKFTSSLLVLLTHSSKLRLPNETIN
jgi:hypothetical protein